jgi:poly(A) polymerase
MEIQREGIDPEADKVVRRLARHGYKAYLVGGCVRDLLLGRKPKDFDVATSATPKDIKQLFRNCRIIGRRFRLAHIFFGSKIIETSTFRANPRQGEEAGNDEDELLIRRDNVFGSEIEDAQRRDFTMNGLFYDVEAETVIDHIGGLKDIEARRVATIGDPDVRFREDPVRILRAIKFAARLDFSIEPDTLAAAVRHRGEIAKCAPPRVLEEVYRLLRGGAARRSIELLCETGTAQVLSPQLAQLFGAPEIDDDALDARRERASYDELEPVAEPSAHETDAADEVDDADTDAMRLDELGDPASAEPAPELDEHERAWAAVWADETPFARHAADPDDDDGYAVPARVVPVRPAAPPLVLGQGADLVALRAYAFRALAELDVLFTHSVEISNAVLAAVLAAPFINEELLQPGLRPAETSDLVDGVLGPLVAQLQIARKDAERARHLLLTLRRLSPGRRRKGASGQRRDVLDEAQLLCDLLAAARGETSEVPYWRHLQSDDDGAGEVIDADGAIEGKRRRRRRGGRRRRRGDDGEDVGGAHLDGAEVADEAAAATRVEPVSV